MTIEITKGSENPVAEFFSSPSRTPNTDDLARGNHVVPTEWAEQLERERDEARHKLELCMAANSDVARIAKERDEARKDAAQLADRLSGLELRTTEELARMERERDEAQKELSSIHRWIERNHADGFIDSLTYSQNLERVTDNWYDRLDRLEVDAGRFEKERDEAREAFKISYNERVQMELDRNEARSKYDTLAVENMLEVNKICKERDEAIEILRQIKASDWKTSGELRGMARIFLDGIK